MKKQHSIIILGALSVLLLLLAACTSGGGEGAVTEEVNKMASMPLLGTQWELVTYSNGQETMENILPETKVTAIFTSEQVGGSAGCNNYFASYTVVGNEITIGPAGSTMMFCGAPEGVMEQETAYLAALQSAAQFQIVVDRLDLLDDQGQPAATFIAGEPVALEGILWEVIAYNNGRQAVTSVIIGSQITLLFEDGSISGNASCNGYFGSYETDGENLTISGVGSTEMFCADPESLMDQEAEYLKALTTAATYTIRDDVLNIRDESGATVLNARPVEG